MHAFILIFALCLIAEPDTCEGGAIEARSCAAAEDYVRAGVQPGQVAIILDCMRRA